MSLEVHIPIAAPLGRGHKDSWFMATKNTLRLLDTSELGFTLMQKHVIVSLAGAMKAGGHT